MKRLLLSLLCIPALLLTFCNDKVNSKEETESPASSAPDQLEKVTYQPSAELLCNPARGSFTHQEYATDNNHSITPAFLKECREKGMSLIFTAYYMRDFKISWSPKNICNGYATICWLSEKEEQNLYYALHILPLKTKSMGCSQGTHGTAYPTTKTYSGRIFGCNMCTRSRICRGMGRMVLYDQ